MNYSKDDVFSLDRDEVKKRLNELKRYSIVGSAVKLSASTDTLRQHLDTALKSPKYNTWLAQEAER